MATAPPPPAPGSLNSSAVNNFGLHQYDGQTSFFNGDYLLPQVRLVIGMPCDTQCAICCA